MSNKITLRGGQRPFITLSEAELGILKNKVPMLDVPLPKSPREVIIEVSSQCRSPDFLAASRIGRLIETEQMLFSAIWRLKATDLDLVEAISLVVPRLDAEIGKRIREMSVDELRALYITNSEVPLCAEAIFVHRRNASLDPLKDMRLVFLMKDCLSELLEKGIYVRLLADNVSFGLLQLYVLIDLARDVHTEGIQSIAEKALRDNECSGAYWTGLVDACARHPRIYFDSILKAIFVFAESEQDRVSAYKKIARWPYRKHAEVIDYKLARCLAEERDPTSVTVPKERGEFMDTMLAYSALMSGDAGVKDGAKTVLLMNLDFLVSNGMDRQISDIARVCLSDELTRLVSRLYAANGYRLISDISVSVLKDKDKRTHRRALAAFFSETPITNTDDFGLLKAQYILLGAFHKESDAFGLIESKLLQHGSKEGADFIDRVNQVSFMRAIQTNNIHEFLR
ncbi:MAG: hypothetical protein ACP5NX_00170 [Candidatus Bilamarchaeaceae archaeon]